MKDKIVLIAAIIFGVLAFVMTRVYLKSEVEKLYEGAKKVSVMVARSDLAQGTVLRSDNMAIKEVFESSLDPKVFRATQRNILIGSVLQYPLKKGEPIDWVDVGRNLNELQGLASTIRSGMRAISISVSNETSVSGLVRPNDNVDILGTFNFMDETNPGEMKTVTFTVLQDVTILATGQETARAELQLTGGRRRSNYSTVTISVFPEEAELLAFAMNVKGTLTLSLRNPDDVSVLEQTPPIDFQTLQRELPRLNLRRQTILGDDNNRQPISR